MATTIRLLQCISKSVLKHHRLFPVIYAGKTMTSSGSNDQKEKRTSSSHADNMPRSHIGTEDTSKLDLDQNSTVLWEFGLPIAGGIICLAALYLGLWALGFCSGGIAAGSMAATMMAKGIPFVPLLQSAGAAGLSTSTWLLSLITGTSAAKYVQRKLSKGTSEEEDDDDQDPPKIKSKL